MRTDSEVKGLFTGGRRWGGRGQKIGQGCNISGSRNIDHHPGHTGLFSHQELIAVSRDRDREVDGNS
jgi:hypothetical protein